MQIVYILGSGYCGSTILNLLLNAHSQILGLSELFTIRNFQPQKWQLICSQPFWQKVNDCYYHQYQKYLAQEQFIDPDWISLLKWDGDTLKKKAQPYWNLYSCIYQISNYPILVDSSKSPKHFYFLHQSNPQKIKVIFLLRDGRGVMYSYFRRYGNINLGLQRWIKTNLFSSIYLQTRFNPEDWLFLKYEDLASNPEKTLKKVCSFLKLSYESNILKDFSNTLDIGLGGNIMKYYKKENKIIKPNEEWKKNLSPYNLKKFNLMGGWLNKIYGY